MTPTRPTPQLLLTLSPEGALVVELPGVGTRHRVELRPGTAEAVLRRMLEAQVQGRSGADPTIGFDAAPTQAQVRRWEQVAAALVRVPEGTSGGQATSKSTEELGL